MRTLETCDILRALYTTVAVFIVDGLFPSQPLTAAHTFPQYSHQTIIFTTHTIYRQHFTNLSYPRLMDFLLFPIQGERAVRLITMAMRVK